MGCVKDLKYLFHQYADTDVIFSCGYRLLPSDVTVQTAASSKLKLHAVVLEKSNPDSVCGVIIPLASCAPAWRPNAAGPYYTMSKKTICKIFHVLMLFGTLYCFELLLQGLSVQFSRICVCSPLHTSWGCFLYLMPQPHRKILSRRS